MRLALRTTIALVGVTIAFAAGVVLEYVLTNPLAVVDQAQAAILGEIHDVYCHVDPKADGYAAAALSRTAIRAGLGTLSVIETTKCRLQLGPKPRPDRETEFNAAQQWARSERDRLSTRKR